MAATQAETQRTETNVEQNPSDQHAESRGLLQNGTDKAVGRVPPDGIVNTKSKSPMSAELGPPRDGVEAPGHDRPVDRPPHDQYGGYRYPEGVDPYYGQRPGFPGKPRPQGPPPQQQQQRFFPGQGPPQAPGPTPTLNSLLQSSGAPPQRYPNSYDQPPAGYGPAPGWPPPRPMPPYNPQAPYRNSAPPRPAGPGYGGAPYGPGPPPGGQQPPAGYGPPGSYPQRYPPPGPPGAPNSRPPYSPHQGYERAGSPQPPHPSGAPSPGLGQNPGALSPNQDSQHPPHPAQHPGHQPPQHQGYPPPPRPAQPSTPNAHDPDTDLAGQNSNDSGGSGGAGRASTPHLRPTPSPTGSGGSRSMSPAVGTQNVPMPPRPSSSLSDGSGPVTRAPGPGPGGPPPGGMLPQPYPHHPYKQHYPPQPYGYPPRGQHPPYPYGGYRHPPPPQHYPPMKGGNVRHMGGPGPGDGAMPPPTAPGAPETHDNGPSAPATALVTTGPDGAPLDEGSQQSTLSNASAASGEEGSGGGGKARKESYGGGGGGGSSAPSPSPGGGSHSAHEDYDASPSPSPWPRPPSSPVFNSHIPPESFRSKKSDSLGKLYEMDETPERRSWVERLLAFMEERRTPIAACPTISKQPLDLYRLYLLVRDRGGFVEVTKNKTWKDIAGLLGIGASSSAAYTLRKHYTKNLLAYECHFDRGGIDPQPIINQVEASTKKKGGKNNSNTSAPANVQETFQSPGQGAPGPPMDGYGGTYTGYPPQPNQSQGAAGGDNLAASNPFEEHPGPRRPQGYQQGYGYEYGSPYPSNRPVYPPYGPEGDRGYGNAPGAANSAGPPTGEYRYGGSGAYGGGGGGYRPPPPAQAVPPPPSAGTPPPQPYPEYYRPPHQPPHQQHPSLPQHANHQPPPVEIGGAASSQSSLMSSQLARQLVAPLPSAGKPYHYGAGKGAAGSAPGPAASPAGQAAGPRRHPDFAGSPGPAPAPGARPPFPGGWGGQFPGRGAAQGPPPPQPWRPPPATGPPPQQQPWPPYGHHPPHQSQGQPAWSGPPAPRPAADQYPPAAAPSPGVSDRAIGSGQVKRELTFPPDCVEATAPSAEKRRRLTKADVAPVDAWRIVMALKSGLLAETCWALDVLNILLFDDSCVGYFGLQHMPGLLDLLLEHFHKSISDVFDSPQPEDRAWYLPPATPEPAPPEKEAKPRPPPPPHERTKLLDGENFTLESRRRAPVVYREEPLFAEDEEAERAARPEDEAREPWQLADALPLPAFPPRVHLQAVRVMGGARRAASPPRAASPRRATPAPSPPPPASPAPRDPDADDLRAAPMELEGGARLEIRDPAAVLKRRRLADLEDECYSRDEPPLNLAPEANDGLARRCLALSNILRSLTFVPGNEAEFSRSGAYLALAGRLLLLHHEHAPRAARPYSRGRGDAEPAPVEPAPLADPEWWWDTLEQLREDALVACANIAGGVELQNQSEAVARPLLDGLLHWAVCGAAVAGDAPAHAPASSPLSPRRLALEALCKLCVCEGNVDLVLATPPRERVGALCEGLARDLCRAERPVVREFAVVLLHALAGAGLGAARQVALHAPAVPQLVAFIERAEQAALSVANLHGVATLRDNPDAMGTSLDMLRRAAATLARLARHPDNHALLRRHERRLLSLVMSQILDQKVAHELADVLYRCSKPADAAPLPLPDSR